MIVYIQWTTATPSDWQPYDLNRVQDVRNLPRKAAPTATSTLDNQPGWVSGINLQGVVFEGFDHYAVEFGTGLLIVRVWNDDPRSGYVAGTRWGQVWTFAPPGPDPALGGLVNTRQTVTWYGEPLSEAVVNSNDLGIVFQPWSAFTVPASNLTWHGFQVSDAQWTAAREARSQRGWREWVA